MLSRETVLFDYQEAALRQIKRIYNGKVGYQRSGAILALGPGFGKTLVSLLAARYIVQRSVGYEEKALPVIVVSEMSPVEDWIATCSKHFDPPLTIEYLGGKHVKSKSAAVKSWHALQDVDVLITNYEMLVQFFDGGCALELTGATEGSRVLYARRWPVVLFDEGHKVRNNNTRAFDAVVAINAAFKLLITATPCNNSVVDLISLFKAVGVGSESSRPWSTDDNDFLGEFRVARHYYIIRGKDYSSEREHYRPVDIVMHMPFDTQVEQHGYDAIRVDHALASIVRYRQFCSGVGNASCTKLRMLLAYLRSVVVLRKEKALVLCDFRESVELIYSTLEHVFGRTIRVFKANGLTTQAERTAIRTSFERVVGVPAVLVVTGIFTQGVNIECANHVVHFDIWWNPVVTDQGRSRIERPNQRRSVFNVQLLMKDTIEEAVWSIAQKKRQLIGRILEGECIADPTMSTDESIEEACLFEAQSIGKTVTHEEIKKTCDLYIVDVDELNDRVPSTQMLVRHASIPKEHVVKRKRTHWWHVKEADMQTHKADLLPRYCRYKPVRGRVDDDSTTMAHLMASSSSSQAVVSRKRTTR